MGKLIPMLPLVIFWGGVAVVSLRYPNLARWLFNPAPWVSELRGYMVMMFFIFALGIYLIAQY